MPSSGTYSFFEVTATLTSVAGIIDLGYGAGNADEGISISMNGAKNVQTTGADGSVMNSLRCENTGTVTVRLLNISNRNAALRRLYNTERISSTAWGADIITITNRANNETTVCRACAFKQAPSIEYGTGGQIVTWVFDAGFVDTVTGEYPQTA